jgi:2-oxo-4-hydroxy-4-carboxy-5-ureidoimidazoline decarboxylase
MTRRIERTPDEEFAEALAQILRIASFRLDDLIA